MSTRSLAQPISIRVKELVGSPLSPVDQLIEQIQNCLDAYKKEEKKKLIDLIIDWVNYSTKIFDEGRGFGFDEDNEETQNTSCIMPTTLSKNRGGDNRIGGFHKGAFHSHLSSKAKQTIIHSKNTKNYKMNQTIINGEKIRALVLDTDTNHGLLSRKIESQISDVIFKDEEGGAGTAPYQSLEKTGRPLIDARFDTLENSDTGTGSLTHSTFNPNDFPYTQEWLEENLPALMARFPFEDIKLKLTIIGADGHEEHQNSVDNHLLYNGDLKDDYALRLTFQRFVLKEDIKGLTPGQKQKLPEELLQLKLQCSDKTKTFYFKNSNIPEKYTFAKSHEKGDDEWYNGLVDDTEISYASLYTKDEQNHYEVTINCLGEEINRKQHEKLGMKYTDGYGPFMNLMNGSLTAIGPEKSYVATKILKECTKRDGYRLKTRTQIKLFNKQQYTACGVSGKKNHPIIDETQMDPFLLSIYTAIGRIYKLLDTICGIKPTTTGLLWSPMQELIRKYGANDVTSAFLFDFGTIIKQLGDVKHCILRKHNQLGRDFGWYKPWDTVNDCLVLSEPESNDSDEVEEDNEVEEDEAEEKVEENVIDEDDDDEEEVPAEDEDVEDDDVEDEDVEDDDVQDEDDDDEEELPISDNTTIPSHDRLCSKTAANARDALPLAWAKMSRNKRMKNFKEDWVHQLTCDEMYAIEERIIAKQCNIDENAKLCGAAELVYLATAEETPNNSSDSE